MGNKVHTETYEEFVEKFKPKKTTDDCYTPPLVYEAVKNWAVKEYGWQGRKIVRPFYPGGDYENYQYPDNCVVIDNPPFSIISKIAAFYKEHKIDYFLFTPHLTNFNILAAKSHVIMGFDIIYENGAKVNTSFICSVGETIRSAPELYADVKDAVKRTQKENAKTLPKFKYPDELVTSSMLEPISRNGIDYREDRACFVRRLDAQREIKKAIFGGGYLVPPEKLRTAKEQAAKEQAAKEQAAKEQAAKVFQLSEKEKEIIKELENE